MIGWKFVPNLIAVIYTQLIAMILGAIKRTESFARLAKPIERVPIARYTLLEKSKPWWTTLFQGFQKKRNGGTINWALVLSSTAYILAILGISPMSAALLGSKEVRQSRTESFKRLVVSNTSSALSPRAERQTYLRTTGALFQNYSTSPWIKDDLVILPFTSDSLPHAGSPWDPRPSTSGTWEVNTTVFQYDLVCTEMLEKKRDLYLRHATEADDSSYNKTYLASVLLESAHGCQFNLTVNATDNPDLKWTGPSGWNFPRFVAADWMSWSDIHGVMFGDMYSNDCIVRLNTECHEDEVILMSTQWLSNEHTEEPTGLLDNLTMRAYACYSDHSMAVIPVRATRNSNGLSVDLDRVLFEQVREPVGPTVLNFQELHEIYTHTAWGRFIPQQVPDDKFNGRVFPGPAAVLGSKYRYNIIDMMADSHIPTLASQIRRRFFAEIIHTSTLRPGAYGEQHTSGTRYLSTRRVFVSGQATSALCILLVLSFCAFLFVLWLSRPTKRPLKLRKDPSTILGLLVWANGGAVNLSSFKTLDLASRDVMKVELGNQVFSTDSGKLDKPGGDGQLSSHGRHLWSSHDACLTGLATMKATLYGSAPILPALRLRNLISLASYAACLFAGTTILFVLAQRSELHQAFFTYRANIKVFGSSNYVLPFAILPTVLAVVITIWWDSVNITCRLVQPYTAIHHATQRPSQGLGLSYASHFWLGASAKALKSRHWLLALITSTTFLVQLRK
jgi:hypothetical protein